MPPAITEVWNTVLVWPIEGALVALTQFTGSAGLAIIVFTVAVRTVLLPLGIKQARSQKAMAALGPQIKDLQKRYAGDRAKQSQEQMRLYRESGVNPAAGCLPMVLQMPIWFALYSSLITLSNNVESFSAPFLWIPNLAFNATQHATPPFDMLYIMPVLSGITQWVDHASRRPSGAVDEPGARVHAYHVLRFFASSRPGAGAVLGCLERLQLLPAVLHCGVGQPADPRGENGSRLRVTR